MEDLGHFNEVLCELVTDNWKTFEDLEDLLESVEMLIVLARALKSDSKSHEEVDPIPPFN